MPQTPEQLLETLIRQAGWKAVECWWLQGSSKLVFVVDAVDPSTVAQPETQPKEMQEVKVG